MMLSCFSCRNASEKHLDDIVLGVLLGVGLASRLGVLSQLVVGVEFLDLLAGATSVHQVDEVDVSVL